MQTENRVYLQDTRGVTFSHPCGCRPEIHPGHARSDRLPTRRDTAGGERTARAGTGGQPRTPGGTPTEPWGASSPACPDAHPASALQTGILSCECVPASAVSMATRLSQNTRCSLAKVPFTFLGSPISAPNSGGKAIAAPTGLAAELLPLGETRVARAEVLAEAGGRETGTLPKCPSPRGLTQGSSVLFWAGAPCTISPSLVHHHCFRVDCGVCVSRCHHVRQLSCEVATVNFSTLERGGAQGHVTDLWL